MHTKLYIPYNVDSKRNEFLLVLSPLRIKTLAATLCGKLLVRGLNANEWLTLFWLSERLKPLERAKTFYLLALWSNSHRKQKGLMDLFPDWFWSHLNLEKAFPSMRGDLRTQSNRLMKQLRLTFRVERRKKIKPRELRWMGVGYRDKGSLNPYKFHIQDMQTDDVQVVYNDLFARLKDDLVTNHIQRAKKDLRTFARVQGTTASSKKSRKPAEESKGLDETRMLNKAEMLIALCEEVLAGKLSPRKVFFTRTLREQRQYSKTPVSTSPKVSSVQFRPD